ncbi:MAG: hypothetical protein WC702_02775 [Patescibacteria group bacterium]
MRYILTGDQLRTALRRLSEIERQLGQAEYPHDPARLLEGLQKLVEDGQPLPTTMVIGRRTYEVLSYLSDSEKSIDSRRLLERSKEMCAAQGEGEGQHFLDHQDEIPAALRKVFIAFLNWLDPSDSSRCACVRWIGGRWIKDWCNIPGGWFENGRLLRRVA